MARIESLPQKRIHRSKNGVHIFVNPYKGGKFVTNDIGARVIELMDQKQEEDILFDEIARELDINAYESAARFLSFTEQLKAHNMFGEIEKAEDSAPQPKVGFLEITRKCNTRCRLCYVDSGQEASDVLDRNEIFQTIDQMAELGIEFIALSGGDPLARQDLPQILEYINKECGITPGISTSLLTLTEQTAKTMKDNNVLIQVSLDGSIAEINDWNRGAGTFAKAMKGLQLLNRHEIPFRLAYVISKHNFEDVENMIKLGLELGAQEVAFGKVKIAGRARDLDGEVLPSPEEITAAYHKLYRNDILTRKTRLIIRCKYNQGLLTGLQERVGCLPCGAGRTFVHVTCNGNIVPCSLLSNNQEFYLGNVRQDKIADIWADSEVYDFFRNTTVNDLDICRSCPAKFLCGGGCRADAYLNSGDLKGPCGDCDDLKYYYDWILNRGLKEEFITGF